MTGRPTAVDLVADLPAGTAGGFTTRLGGTSRGRWASMDLARHVGDDPVAVARNRARLEQRVGRAVRWATQVHGREVLVVDGVSADTGPHDAEGTAADALVTATAGPAVGVLAADCVPVLLADPRAGVVAAVHAGRRGLHDGVLDAALASMAGLGATAADTTAVIGPAVCGRCYEVPPELRDAVGSVVPEAVATSRTGTPSLDLPAGAAAVLRRRGVGVVRRTGICTVEDERFYSYRRDGDTGRHAGVIWLTGG